MKTSLEILVCIVFVVLALWHFVMALHPASWLSATVPSRNGHPLFVPSRRAAAVVGVALLLFAAIVATTAGFLSVGLPSNALSWLSYALALGLLGRAIGEFKYIGFFKRVRGSEFARLDTFLYSPLCLVLAIGVALIALHNGA